MPVDLRNYLPSTLEEAVSYLYSQATPEEHEYMRASEPEQNHQLLGRAIRNEWSLWQGDGMLRTHFMQCYGLDHADDMSSMILTGLYCKVRGMPYDPAEDANHFRHHWHEPSTIVANMAASPWSRFWRWFFGGPPFPA